MLKNKQTGKTHTGAIPTIAAAICFLLGAFDIVPAEKLTVQVQAALITVIGGIVMLVRNHMNT